jgi:hypothetical protein
LLLRTRLEGQLKFRDSVGGRWEPQKDSPCKIREDTAEGVRTGKSNRRGQPEPGGGRNPGRDTHRKEPLLHLPHPRPFPTLLAFADHGTGS